MGKVDRETFEGGPKAGRQGGSPCLVLAQASVMPSDESGDGTTGLQPRPGSAASAGPGPLSRGGRRWFLPSVFAAALLFMGSEAKAFACSAKLSEFLVSVPVMPSIPADLPNNRPIGGWLEPTLTESQAWSCSLGVSLDTVTIGTDITNATDGVVDGYPVFKTSATGVGVIFEWAPILPNGQCAYRPLTTGLTIPPGCSYVQPSATKNYGMSIRARLVKTGAVIYAGGTVSLGNAAVKRNWGAYDGDKYIPIRLRLPDSPPAVLSCETPSTIDVPLGRHPVTNFSGIGSMVGEKAFHIPLRNCPPGMNGVSFKLHAIDGFHGSATDGVARLSSDSTADGVGVKITQPEGGSVGFDLFHGYGGYNSATGGNFDIPLKGSYVQTGPAVLAGNANAAVMFTVSYE